LLIKLRPSTSLYWGGLENTENFGKTSLNKNDDTAEQSSGVWTPPFQSMKNKMYNSTWCTSSNQAVEFIDFDKISSHRKIK